jgi:FkbM family methyltransferase
MLMQIKRVLRRAGFDVVKYHPLYDFLLEKYRIDTILDIGANVGQFAMEIHEHLPEAMIYSFEPLKDDFEKLEEMGSKLPKFKAFNFALGETNGIMEIEKSSFSPSSSFLTMSETHKNLYPKSADLTKETVVIKKLDDIADEMNTNGNMLIKLDVQGFEDKVILGGKNLVTKARMLVIETAFTKLYEGQPLFDDIEALVHPLGFRYNGTRETHWNKDSGELLYQDSIFVK